MEKLNSVLAEVQAEIKRFEAKLIAHVKRQEEMGDSRWMAPSKEAAALRRSALDLKNQLTRITQSQN